MIAVEDLKVYTRTSDGRVRHGEVKFKDGKHWEFGVNIHTQRVFFVIDSGRASQWATGNERRQIEPPKRVEAVMTHLAAEGERL